MKPEQTKTEHNADILFDKVHEMHAKFGFHEAADGMTNDRFWEFMKFRVNVQMREELEEILTAIENRDAEELFDGLIDIDVFQKGTVDFLVSKEKYLEGYARVMDANLAKERGIKPGRPNPFRLPDLLKPEGWTAPTHEGLFDEIQAHFDRPGVYNDEAA
uniref:Hydrolase n=2 Tax=unclassified Caudoviricetes TaxID=2788787 RepID=A0AAU8HY91_9CAUD